MAETWAEFVRRTTFDDLPEDVVGRAKLAILDAIAVSGAGATTPAALAAERYVRSREPAHTTGIAAYPKPFRYGGPEAAGFVQGVYGYGHLYGDTSLRSVSHPGAVVVPAVLVAAHARPVSGRDAITAIALGYEVMEAFARRLNGQPPRMSLQIRGFRPTPTCGPLGVAASAGRLAGLDGPTLASALGIASNHATGLRPNDGDPLASILMQTGTAVQLGLAAVDQARAGVRGNPLAFEGRGGFLDAFGGAPQEPVEPSPGAGWAITSTAVKLHATAHTLAPVLDLLLRLRREHGLDASTVSEVLVSIPEAHIKISGGEKALPASGFEATANYPYGAAVALVTGDYLWPAALERHLADPAVAALAARVRVRSDPELTARFDRGDALWPARVEVRTATSGSLTAEADRPDGTVFDEATAAAVRRKFEALLPHWPAPAPDPGAIADHVLALEDSEDFAAGLWAASGLPTPEGATSACRNTGPDVVKSGGGRESNPPDDPRPSHRF